MTALLGFFISSLRLVKEEGDDEDHDDDDG